MLSDKMSGSTSGFDYLRVVLAVSVLAWHSYPLAYGEVAASQFMSGWGGPFVRLVLPMFFALSGFLVAASLERNTIPIFAGLRVIRIVPALTVEIILSALILGPLLTTLPLHDYFANSLFAKYFLNVFGLVQFELPGLFASNPYPNVVNGSLWTVPFELECYLALVILALMRLVRPSWLLAMVVIGGVALVALSGLKEIPDMKADGAVPGRGLILCFLAGVLVYKARERLPNSGALCFACIALCLALLTTPKLYVFCALPAAYATVWLGLLNIPKLPLIFKGDYSYGIYLYAFPIQQSVVMAFPGMGYAGLFAASLLGVSLCAAFSWQAIERPALRLRKVLPSLTTTIRQWARNAFGKELTNEEFDARQW